MSSHSEISDNFRGKAGDPKTSNATSIWVHVVPHLGGVLITTSPARNSKSVQRALSATTDRYRLKAISASPRSRQLWREADRGALGGQAALFVRFAEEELCRGCALEVEVRV